MRLLITLFAAVLLTACSPQEKVPEAYGVYVWRDSNWVLVRDSQVTISVDLPPETKFLIHDKAIERTMKTFQLAKKIYIRDIVQKDPGNQPPREVKPYKKWDLQKSYSVMKGQFSPVKGHSEMVTWTPASPLAAGIYAPFIEGDEKEAFFVFQKAVLGDLELGPDCFDLVKTNFGGIPMGTPDEYKPCMGDPTQELIKTLRPPVKVAGESMRVAKLLAKGADVNARDGNENTPVLGLAIRWSRTEIVDILIKAGALANSISRDGRDTPVSFEAWEPAILKILIDSGLNVNARNLDNMTALHVFVSSPTLVTMLLDKGADINAVDKWGKSPLARALLIRQGAQESTSGGDKSQNNDTGLQKLDSAIEILRKRGAKT